MTITVLATEQTSQSRRCQCVPVYFRLERINGLTTLTDPSAKSAMTPPVWRLRAAANA